MKKIVLFAAATSLLLGASVSAVAAANTNSWEHRCTVRAQRHHIPGDKVEAYVKACVAKHEKATVRKTAAHSATPAPAAPAAAK